MWTKERIADLLRTNDRAVERAMIALYNRQTYDEKQTSDTHHLNAQGFTAAHAKKGSRFARWCISGRRLTGWHLDRAREIALHYTKQLTDEANANTPRKLAARDLSLNYTRPPAGSWAETAHAMVQLGLMSGDDADEWKDMMKDREDG